MEEGLEGRSGRLLPHRGENRSALLERAALAYLDRLAEEERDARDLAIINRNTARLNREALDTLAYQQLR